MKMYEYFLTVGSAILAALLLLDAYPELLRWWQAVKSPTLTVILWLVAWGIQFIVFPTPDRGVFMKEGDEE